MASVLRLAGAAVAIVAGRTVAALGTFDGVVALDVPAWDENKDCSTVNNVKPITRAPVASIRNN